MNDERRTDELATRVLGWRLAPGRYLKVDRGWVPRSRFQPLVNLNDAFRLLDAAAPEYIIHAMPGGLFTVEVRLAGRIGKSTGEPKARAISLALFAALGIGGGE